MITFKKQKNKDFTILNLTDFQLQAPDWTLENQKGQIILHTINTLMERVKPDLITISGDLTWCGDYDAQRAMCSVLDTLGVPWCPLWGNHDQDHGIHKLDNTIEIYSQYKSFRYENGPLELGRGNYVIAIEEDGRIVEGIIMVDTHDRLPFVKEDGEEIMAWGKALPPQIEWYKEQVKALSLLGCKETMLITHAPIYAYHHAFDAAFNKDFDPKTISVKDSYGNECWNEGYEGSFGVKREDISSYPADEGFFGAIKELGSTKNLLCGHDHVSNFSIVYEGVRFTYALKTGSGCYWNPDLNGGTVIKINKKGVSDIYHEYVDVSEYVQ